MANLKPVLQAIWSFSSSQTTLFWKVSDEGKTNLRPCVSSLLSRCLSDCYCANNWITQIRSFMAPDKTPMRFRKRDAIDSPKRLSFLRKVLRRQKVSSVGGRGIQTIQLLIVKSQNSNSLQGRFNSNRVAPEEAHVRHNGSIM